MTVCNEGPKEVPKGASRRKKGACRCGLYGYTVCGAALFCSPCPCNPLPTAQTPCSPLPNPRRPIPPPGWPSSMTRSAKPSNTTLAGDRRRRVRQDQHAGAPRRASDRQGRRSAPHPADDVFAPRRVEMTRRVERIAGKVLGDKAAVMTRGADLGRHVSRHRRAACLREYAELIGLDPAFTIHDREDSADLMNLVRHELGLVGEGAAGFRPRAPALRSIRAASIPARRSNGARTTRFRGAASGSNELRSCSPPMSRPSSARTCSITTICCSTGRR
jgi:hypothetical protein